MILEKAEQIIYDNYNMNENSLTLTLYDDCEFSTQGYWDLYEAISTVVKAGKKTEVLTKQIVTAYQIILKNIISHFDPNDGVVLRNFPKNYHEYMERLDLALRAYFDRNPEWLKDELFDFQKPR